MSEPPLHRVRIALRSPLGTALSSGTIFGHLCWAVRESKGEAALVQWLEAQDSEPWLVSDGFAPGLLPRPLLTPGARPVPQSTAEADEAKKRNRLSWVKAGHFRSVRGALNEERIGAGLDDLPWTSHAAGGKDLQDRRVAHNSIDRHTQTTPDEGGLFFVDEDWSFAHSPERDIYVRSHASRDEIAELFAAVGGYGYGRDATWGRGRFDVTEVARADDLGGFAGSHRLSLSHGVLTENMREARYRVTTHFGKLADRMAHEGTSPFKQPILLARPGATFRPGDDGPFGRLLDQVHPGRAEIRHDARHVTVGFNEVTP